MTADTQLNSFGVSLTHQLAERGTCSRVMGGAPIRHDDVQMADGAPDDFAFGSGGGSGNAGSPSWSCEGVGGGVDTRGSTTTRSAPRTIMSWSSPLLGTSRLVQQISPDHAAGAKSSPFFFYFLRYAPRVQCL